MESDSAGQNSPILIQLGLSGGNMNSSNKTKNDLNYCAVPSPLGDVILAEHGGKICIAEFKKGSRAKTWLKEISEHFRAEPVSRKSAPLKQAERQLKLYLAGKIKNFDLAIDLVGSDFQKSIWTQLRKIPYGKTINYSRIAERAGRPKASRAAGAAVGRNRISIIVPCHRVVGKDGSLTGYGGGIWRKEWLLKHEGAF
jgi:AraC family transcriptional regulator of adaptative response/methylated-DNA-[protein]-cysteine methyltransferase